MPSLEHFASIVTFVGSVFLFIESLKPATSRRINRLLQDLLAMIFSIRFLVGGAFVLFWGSLAVTVILFILFYITILLSGKPEIFGSIIMKPMIFPGSQSVVCFLLEMMFHIKHGFWWFAISMLLHGGFVHGVREIPEEELSEGGKTVGFLIFMVICIWFGLPVQTLQFSVVVVAVLFIGSLFAIGMAGILTVYVVTMPISMAALLQRMIGVRLLTAALGFLLSAVGFLSGIYEESVSTLFEWMLMSSSNFLDVESANLGRCWELNFPSLYGDGPVEPRPPLRNPKEWLPPQPNS